MIKDLLPFAKSFKKDQAFVRFWCSFSGQSRSKISWSEKYLPRKPSEKDIHDKRASASFRFSAAYRTALGMIC